MADYPTISNIPKSANPSVENFKHSFYNEIGLHKNTKYEVKFHNVPMRAPMKDERIYQPEVVSFPGRTINFLSLPTAHSYPISVPKSLGYDFSLGMTFPLSLDAHELRFFEEWMNALVDPNGHFVKYYDDTIAGCKLELNLLDEQGTFKDPKTRTKIVFRSVFPAAIQPIDFSAGNVNQYSKISVLFKFYKYDIDPWKFKI